MDDAPSIWRDQTAIQLVDLKSILSVVLSISIQAFSCSLDCSPGLLENKVIEKIKKSNYR